MSKVNKILGLLEDDYENIYEMANIPPSVHNFGINVKLNVIQPGNKKIKHGPRIKIFKRVPSDGFAIILNKEKNKIRLDPDNKKESIFLKGKELRLLITNIKKYRTPLLKLWNDPGMDIIELRRLMDKIDNEKS